MSSHLLIPKQRPRVTKLRAPYNDQSMHWRKALWNQKRGSATAVLRSSETIPFYDRAAKTSMSSHLEDQFDSERMSFVTRASGK